MVSKSKNFLAYCHSQIKTLEQINPGIYAFLLFCLVLIISTVIIYIKIDSLFAWRYTSDLFLYEQILTETLQGNFGIEYTYGNQFGIHAYFFLLVFLPVKFILGNYNILFILLTPTFFYAITTMLIFWGINTLLRNNPFSAFLCGLIFLFSFKILEGLYQKIYGVQLLDDLAGFFAVLFVIFLQIYKTQQKKLAFFLLFYCSFLLLREDMAILGTLFFLCLFLCERTRFNLLMGIVSFLVLAAEKLFINHFATIFGGTYVQEEVQEFLHEIRHTKIIDLLLKFPLEYVLTLSMFVLGLIILIIMSRKVNIYAVSLGVIGLCKIGFGRVIEDTDLTTWHNYPGILMMIGALIIQLTELHKRKFLFCASALLIASIFVGMFICDQLPFAQAQIALNKHQRQQVLAYRNDLRELISQIDPKTVVAIDGYTAIEWILKGYHRFSYYPRGVSWSPRGIAEYIVIENEQTKLRNPNNPYTTQQEIEAGHPEFQLIAENPSFLLLKRTSMDQKNQISREEWIKNFGAQTLGIGERE